MRVSVPTNYLFIIITGLCVLLFVIDRLNFVPGLRQLTLFLYEWLLLLGAFTLILGSVNVIWFHWRRIIYGRAGWTHSIALLVSFLAVLLGGLLSETGVESTVITWILDAIIAPGQATLISLVAFFMAIAAFRFLRVRSPGGAWMLAGTLIVLLVQMPVGNWLLPDAFAEAASWSLNVPAMAALRGVLIGSTIALVLFGIRFLLHSQ